MKIIVHGDDYGRSKGITDNMSEAIDKGCMNSVSIPANGHGYDYAIEEYKKRKNIRLSIHLDLVEWKPLTDPKAVPLLINDQGLYENSFVKLWLKYLTANAHDKKQLREQVKREIDAQITKVRYSFIDQSDFEINIDSHQHFHMIPFVFDVLIELATKHKIKYIRLGNEPFFLCFQGKNWLQNYLGSNLIKHFLLKILSIRYKKILDLRNIKYCDYFIGLLFTGSMSVAAVKRALSQIRKNDVTVEILLHACKAVPGEEHLWKDNDFLFGYYYSDMRDYEKAAVLDPELAIVTQ